ncbi:Acetyltransferase (GNAT) domain-containing protein [Clostridium cavendishii DSM 21758]|uniref:Acetyltransferase (GNAT) domain-containing protein n=1 Tax=Clostridium cavendishii DSM 21758 TaxID=1121302 RepID=A0A1M6W494_9CLOT|nr:GNAT family N-acetyltransferase [Clostridium cavendishii]SHK88527.1 Acetyltransferase (GNAT) domain-containing protein [Clostridium cavendishii DSM 21758]
MLEINKANIDDAKLITDIKIKAYNKEINTYLGRNGGPSGYNEVASQIDIIKNFIAYKIELDNQIIGALFLIPLEGNKMRFEDFVIEPSFQGKGYGYRVMELIERTYPDINEWQLSTPIFSVGNQHLYKKFGYTEVLRNEDEIEYIKKIEL